MPVKKHHFLPLKIAGAVAKAVLSNMEDEAVVAPTPTPAPAENITEEITYEPAPAPFVASAPVVAAAPVPTFPAGNDTHWNTTVSWSG